MQCAFTSLHPAVMPRHILVAGSCVASGFVRCAVGGSLSRFLSDALGSSEPTRPHATAPVTPLTPTGTPLAAYNCRRTHRRLVHHRCRNRSRFMRSRWQLQATQACPSQIRHLLEGAVSHVKAHGGWARPAAWVCKSDTCLLLLERWHLLYSVSSRTRYCRRRLVLVPLRRAATDAVCYSTLLASMPMNPCHSALRFC